MNVLKYRVYLDMHDVSSQTIIKAKKCDSACQIYITLTDNGRIYEVGEGCYATFNAKKADGNFIYDNCTIENNTIVYDFSSSIDDNGICQVSVCEGAVECEVTLYNDKSEQLTSPRFTLIIDDTVYNGEEIVSTTHANVLKELINEANKAVEEIETKLASGEFKGEKGEKGDQGEQGIQGEKGEKGDKGDSSGVPMITPSIVQVDSSWAFSITSDELKGEVGELFIMFTPSNPPAASIIINGKAFFCELTEWLTDTAYLMLVESDWMIRVVGYGTGASITVDAALSETSENPVQNKVITKALYTAGEALETLGQEVENLKENGGSGEVEADILPEQDITTADMNGDGSMFGTSFSPPQFKLVEGETYYACWDGTVYSCVCVALNEDGMNYRAIGNASLATTGENTGEPFLLVYMTAEGFEANVIACTDTAPTTHVVRIYQKVTPPNLPIVTADDNGKLLQVVDGVWTAVTIANGNEVTY